MKKKPVSQPAPALAPAPVVPELATKAHDGTPRYGNYGHPSTEPAPEPAPDHRAEGGDVFDLHNEQTTL